MRAAAPSAAGLLCILSCGHALVAYGTLAAACRAGNDWPHVRGLHPGQPDGGRRRQACRVCRAGGLTVRGVASSGRYGYGNGSPDLTFKCKVDYRGAISDIDIDPAQGAYGYNNGYGGYNGYNGYSNDPYAAYGYRRY